MKKFIILALCLCLPLTFAGCYNQKPNHDTSSIIVYPDDQASKTLAGYREEDSESSANEIGSTYYIANTSSKKFHISTCGSAKNMKKENQKIATDRQQLVDEGYSPCGSCKP